MSLAVDRRLGVLKTGTLFQGVLADDIARLMGQAAETLLPAGQPVPRVVAGVDTAWFILEGEYRGAVLYPEALIVSQVGWGDLDIPPNAMPAMPITRSVFNAFCHADPAVGVKLLTNAARLIAADLRDG